MASNITTYFDQAQLALAAYAIDLTPNTVRDVYEQALQDAGMTAAQATRFANRYEIIDSQQNTFSGFAATLFRERITPETLAAGTAGQYRFAVRGTEFDIDKVADLLLSDVGGILSDGLAGAQIVEMYNYYQRLITPANENVAQWVEVSELMPDGLPISHFEKTGTTLGLEKLAAGTPLTVAGHSLGGHLAAAFSRLFPEATAYAFNGAGFYDNASVNSFFNQIAGHPTIFNPATITNIFGDAGPEVIANAWWHTQYGARIPVFIENQLQVPNYEAALNHSMKILTD